MTWTPRLVLVEHPVAAADANIEARNRAYARAAMLDCLRLGEAPFSSGFLYAWSGVLDDHAPEEREAGIAAGLAWGEQAEATVVYMDLGVTAGMERGIAEALSLGRPVEYRTLPGWADSVIGWQRPDGKGKA